MYKVLDLFAGAGGLSLGFEQTRKFEVVVAIEKHPAAQLTYKKNHGPKVEVLDDILEITDYSNFKEKYGSIDIIIGGPPCQGFSNANRQKFDLISQNNSLVKKYIEFIEQLKPKAFVMENVPMFKSATHRFYISYKDNEEELARYIFEDNITLFKGNFPFGIDFLREMGEKSNVKKYLIEGRLLRDLILVEKRSSNEKKMKDLYEKRGLKLINEIKNAMTSQSSDLNEYDQYVKNSLVDFSDFIESKISINDISVNLRNFIDVQRYFYIIQELKDNNIKYSGIELNGDFLEVKLKAITVFNYLIEKLSKEYVIDEKVLNAAWFGAPQIRKRFIVMGIRKDSIKEKKVEIKLPTPIYTEIKFRTVEDAIKDLEGEVPQYEVGLKPLRFSNWRIEKNTLLDNLRDDVHLYNHVITQTREHILIRFEQLKQGQNFHDLDERFTRSYSIPTRTQNSIYKRLDYSVASPTVTNVRKSMWIHPTENRAISIREAARLQTFPDSFIFKGTKDAQYQQVGNAVPPLLSNAIAKKLLNILEVIDI